MAAPPPKRTQLATKAAKNPRVCSDKWMVRVTAPESFLKIKCEVLLTWIDTLVVYGLYHTGESTKENPHVHFIIHLSSVLQKQSFDIRIKSLFETSGNAGYSTQVWDGNYGHGAGSYMFHESDESPCLVRKGVSDEQIAEMKSANKLVQKVMAQANEKANTKLIGKAMEEFKDTYWNQDLEFKIFQFMVKEVIAGNNYHPGEFQLKKYVQEVHMRLCPAASQDQYIETLYNKYFLR